MCVWVGMSWVIYFRSFFYVENLRVMPMVFVGLWGWVVVRKVCGGWGGLFFGGGR